MFRPMTGGEGGFPPSYPVPPPPITPLSGQKRGFSGRAGPSPGKYLTFVCLSCLFINLSIVMSVFRTKLYVCAIYAFGCLFIFSPGS